MRVRSCRDSDSPGEEQQKRESAVPQTSALLGLLNGSRNKDLYSTACFRLLSDCTVLALHITYLSLLPEQGRGWLEQDESARY